MEPLPPHAVADAALESHPDPMLLVGAAGTLLGFNAAAREWFARADGSLPADIESAGLPAAALDADRLPGCDHALTRADGSSAHFRIRAGKARGNSHRLLVLTPVDDLVDAVAQARELRTMHAAAREFGRLGVWTRDVRTLEGRWDSQAFRIWGLDGADTAPHQRTLSQAVVPADRPGLEATFLASASQAGNYGHRFRIRHPDGSLRRVHAQWAVIDGDDGRPARAVGVFVDDTEAWELARSHDTTVQQLAAAVEVGQIAIWRCSVNTRTVTCNEVAQRLLGFDHRGDLHTVDEFLSRIHPDDAPFVRDAAQQALDQRGPVDVEVRLKRRDGQWRHVQTRLVVERAPEGTPLEWVGVSLDVTQRRQDARRARELLRRFNLAARAAGIGHWSLEQGARRILWSEELHAMHGLPPGATVPCIRDWLARHVHEADRQRVGRSYKDWIGSGRPALELSFRLLRADGQVRHVITHSRLEGERDRPLFFGIVIDVTSRLVAEEALRQASARAALIATGVGLGTWQHDLRAQESVWDEQMFRLRGLPVGARALTPAERLALVHPDDRPLAHRQFERLKTETAPLDFEFRVCLPDGRVRWIASRSIAECDEHGRPVRRIGVNWDITDQRSAVAEREERLAAQREVQAKARFLSHMSHELRTPLNAVLGFTQLLLAENGHADTPTRARRLEHIRSAGRHLLSLIDDVLDLSRLEGGELSIALQPVPLAPLVHELLPLIEAQAREHGVSLRATSVSAVPMADPTRLRQVLLNLLTNAVKYNRAGGAVEVEAAAADGVVMLAVSDTGRGMSPEQMAHLYEPFNRLGAERLGVEGTGIGLAIVKALVERMGGTVHVESAPDRGTRFELRLRDGRDCALPAGELASPRALALALTAGRVGRGGKVLYIEDNTVNTLIVGELLARRPDLRLHTADSGKDGLRAVHEQRPNLVLLDMQLPDIDGFEVFRRLQDNPATARIPCIALSANAMTEDIERAMRAGFADYLTKPLDFRAFTASIEAVFGPAPN